MVEIGFVFLLWSVKENHRDREMKGQHRELESRESQRHSGAHTQRAGRGAGEGWQAPGQGLGGCQAQLICSQGIKGLREPSLAVT